MIKRFLFIFLATGLCGIASAWADQNVRAAQNRLKEAGFYFREVTGVYDSDTAAAVTRYQIRNGLEISGKIDAATAKALGLKTKGAGLPQSRTEREGWPILRKRDPVFLARHKSDSPAAPPAQVESANPPAKPSQRQAHSPEYRWSPAFDHERLRDYVGAFVLAGLDPQPGAELEFFAENVNYFNEGSVGREKIRRDLARYNARWPERRFWLDGSLQVEPRPKGRLRVTFPLRYEVRNSKATNSGRVLKSLVLEEAGDDLRIVEVNETKTR